MKTIQVQITDLEYDILE